MSVIAIPEVLRERLGPEGAEALVELLRESARVARDEVVTLAEERFRRALAEEGAQLRLEIGKVREDLSALDARLARDKADFLRWLFVFWVGQAGVVLTLVLGTLFAFFRLFKP